MYKVKACKSWGIRPLYPPPRWRRLQSNAESGSYTRPSFISRTDFSFQFGDSSFDIFDLSLPLYPRTVLGLFIRCRLCLLSLQYSSYAWNAYAEFLWNLPYRNSSCPGLNNHLPCLVTDPCPWHLDSSCSSVVPLKAWSYLWESKGKLTQSSVSYQIISSRTRRNTLTSLISANKVVDFLLV